MKGYIHIDDVYRLIAGHSNYHGDDILSALTCIAEGKNVTKPITPLNEEDCSFEKLPSVTPNEKTGHWVNAKAGKLFPSNDFKCSECGNLLDFDSVNCGRGDANYCPNCGARMVSE